MNKREVVLGLLEQDKLQTYIPAGFFLHFDEKYHRGQAAVDRHLEFFHHTGMDFVKIQYEHTFPKQPEIQNPPDWARMPFHPKEFYEAPLAVVDGLVKAAKKEALVILTLYSPFMCAGQAASQQIITEHIRQDPESVKKGMEIVTDSLLVFVRECIKLGIDGFYHSTQGGESRRFEDPGLFDRCIKPYDLILMEEINWACPFNILHVCDYYGGYDDLTPFLDYPGDVVNVALEVDSERLTGMQISRMFNRPFMGGIDRLGTIATGTEDEIRRMTEAVLRDAPEKFILGADCTIPSDANWDNLKTAISVAHTWKR